MESNVAEMNSPAEVDVISSQSVSKVNTCLPLDMECSDVQIPYDVLSDGDSSQSMDLECSEIENAQEDQTDQERFDGDLKLGSFNVEQNQKTLSNKDTHQASSNLESSNITNPSSEDTSYSSLNMECSDIQDDQPNEMLSYSDTDSANEPESGEEMFYSSLNLVNHQSETDSSDETNTHEDTRDYTLNVASSDQSETDSSDETNTHEDTRNYTLNVASSDVPNLQNNHDECTSLDQECNEVEEDNSNVSSTHVIPKRGRMPGSVIVVKFTKNQDRIPHTTAFDELVVETSGTEECQSEIDCQLHRSLPYEPCLMRKKFRKKSQRSDVVIQNADVATSASRRLVILLPTGPDSDNLQNIDTNTTDCCLLPTGPDSDNLQNIDTNTTDCCLLPTGPDSDNLQNIDTNTTDCCLLPTGPDSDNLQNIDTNTTDCCLLPTGPDSDNLQNIDTNTTDCCLLPTGPDSDNLQNIDTNTHDIKPASQNSETSLGSRLSVENSNVLNISSEIRCRLPGAYSLLQQPHLQSHSAQMKLVNENQTVSQSEFPSISQPEEAITKSIQCLNNDKSTFLPSYPHNKLRKSQIPDLADNYCERSETSSLLQCDENGCVYYVKGGVRKCLNVKRDDLQANATAVIHSLVCRMFALQKCVKYCSERDGINLSRFIKQELKDAEDLELLLKKYDVNAQNFGYFDEITTEEEHTQYHSRQSLSYSSDLLPEGSDTTINSSMSVDQDGEDVGGLSIKIESVFSLSDELTTIDTGKQSPDLTDEEIIFPSIKRIKQKRLARKERQQYAKRKRLALEIPSYVVLERLTAKRLEKAMSLESVTRCSAYCREVTLQLMCRLGLTGCEKNRIRKKPAVCDVGTQNASEHMAFNNYSVYHDHNYACIDEPKQTKTRYNQNNNVQTNSKVKWKIGDNIISRNKNVKQVPQPVKTHHVCYRDTRVDKKIRDLIRHYPDQVKRPFAWNRKPVKKTFSVVFTNAIKCTEADKNKIGAMAFLSSPSVGKGKKKAIKDTDHRCVANMSVQEKTTPLSDPTKLLVRTKPKTDDINSNVLTTVSKPQFEHESKCSVSPTKVDDQIVMASPAITENKIMVGQQPYIVTYVNVPSRKEKVQKKIMSLKRIHKMDTNLPNPIDDNLDLINKPTLEVKISEEARSTSITDSVGMTNASVVNWSVNDGESKINISVTQPMVEGIKENEDKSHNQLPVTHLTKLKRKRNTVVVARISGSSAIKTSSRVVKTQHIPNPSPHFCISNGGKKLKSVSLLMNNASKTDTYHSLVNTKTNNAIKPEVTSSPSTLPDPMQRYALCVFNDTSYLVPLSTGEALSEIESNGIVDRLMSYVQAKSITSTNSRSLLNIATSSSSFTSVSYVPITSSSSSSSVMASSLASSVTLGTLQSVVPSSDAHSFSLLSCPGPSKLSESSPVPYENATVACTQSSSISDIKPDKRAGKKRRSPLRQPSKYPSKYDSRKALVDFLNKNRLIRVQQEPETSLAENLPAGVIVNKEQMTSLAENLPAGVIVNKEQMTSLAENLPAGVIVNKEQMTSLAENSLSAGVIVNKEQMTSLAENSLSAGVIVNKEQMTSLAENSLPAGVTVNKEQMTYLAENSLLAGVTVNKEPETSLAENSLPAEVSVNKEQMTSLAENSLPAGVTVNKEPETSLAENSLLAGVTVNKELVDKEADHCINNKLPEGEVFSEPMDSNPAQGSSLFAQQPVTRLVDEHWQEIWCSDIIPADDSVSRCMSDCDALETAQDSHGTSAFLSGESLFEKMYSTLNLLHSRTEVKQAKTKQKETICHESKCSAIRVKEENPSSPEAMSIQYNCSSKLEDNVNSSNKTIDTKTNVFIIQQEKIRCLKEMLCQKEEELKQLRNKSQKVSE